MTMHPVWRKYMDRHKEILPNLEPQPSGCINWVGPVRNRVKVSVARETDTHPTPYKRPYMSFMGRKYSPRRFMFELATRTLLDPAERLRCTCKNQLCVNPDHTATVVVSK